MNVCLILCRCPFGAQTIVLHWTPEGAQIDLFAEHIRQEYCFLLYWRLLLTAEESSKQVLQPFHLNLLITFLQYSAAILVLHREIYLLIFKKCNRGFSLIVYLRMHLNAYRTAQSQILLMVLNEFDNNFI